MSRRERARTRQRLEIPSGAGTDRASAPREVTLRIERLTMEGLPSSERYRIGPVVEKELARVLAERGVPAGLSAPLRLDRMSIGTISIPPGARAEAVAKELSEALHGGLQRMKAASGVTAAERRGPQR